LAVGRDDTSGASTSNFSAVVVGIEMASSMFSGGDKKKKDGSTFSSMFQSKEDKGPTMDDACPKMNRTQRLYGFFGCMILGALFSFFGWLMLIGASKDRKKVSYFAVFYGFGQIIAVCSTCFLSGPKRQCKRMFDKTRRGATAFYLGMILLVMAVALARPDLWPLVIFLMIIQFAAAIWYAASYIPYGRRILTDLFKRICLCGAVK
jgi:hypothetical protein